MNNFKNLVFDGFSKDLWTYLKGVTKPILIYGMGNGADKIIEVLEKYEISYSDVFASDGFVRGHSYKGKVVISYSDAVKKYGNDFIILLSFGTKLNDVLSRIYDLTEVHELYAPDVPVYPDNIFNEEFFDTHISQIEEVYNLFADEKSKQTYLNILKFKITGKINYLKECEVCEKNADNLLKLSSYKSYLDLGAYNGDTVRKYLDICPNIKEVYAFEPDRRNFKKLSEYAENEIRAKVNTFNYLCGNDEGVVLFSASGNRNSSKNASASYQSKVIEIEQKRPDSIIDSIDFIKYDVEGEEYNTILGCKKLIENSSPDLLVSMYHKSEDIFTLPLLLKELNPYYYLYLRKLPYVPAWDLNLYAIKK